MLECLLFAPLCAGLLMLLLGNTTVCRGLLLLTAVLHTALSVKLAADVSGGLHPQALAGLLAPDALGTLFLVLASVLFLVASVYGVGYLRDGGDRWGVCDLAAKLAPEYGIRYRSPGFPIYKTGHYGGFIGRGFDGLAEYRALVREAKTRGAHFIKLMISGLMDFSQYGVLTGEPLPPDLIRDMIACAHDEGFSVMAHANGDEAVRAALAGSVDSIEHGAYLTDETLCQLAESRAVWVPTLVTIGNLIGCGRFPDEVLKPLLAYQRNAVKKAAALGAKIACGSDAGAYRVLHGQGGMDERALLRRILGEGADAVLDTGNTAIMARF